MVYSYPNQKCFVDLIYSFVFAFLCWWDISEHTANTHSQKEHFHNWIPRLVGPGHTFRNERKDSLAVARGHFLLIFFLYQTAALNYRIFLCDVAVPGLQLVPGITDARLERWTFIRLKETARPVFVDSFRFSGEEIGIAKLILHFLKCSLPT